MEDQNLDYVQKPEKGPGAVALKYGVIGGLVFCIYTILSGLLNLQEMQWVGTIISFGLLIIFIYLPLMEHRDKELAGSMTYGRGVGTGMLTALYISIIAGIFMYIYTAFIDPSIVEESIRAAREGFIESDMSDEEMDMAMQWTRTMTSPPFMGVWIFLGNMFFSLIITLIVAAIMRRG